mmetsp:Transcript_6940/g.14376  ORF Transcript_6940/g.14376 Transcript_6940/m.14376 type:complete len:130 (-) Transcript_6940:3405-3794(-)
MEKGESIGLEAVLSRAESELCRLEGLLCLAREGDVDAGAVAEEAERVVRAVVGEVGEGGCQVVQCPECGCMMEDGVEGVTCVIPPCSVRWCGRDCRRRANGSGGRHNEECVGRKRRRLCRLMNLASDEW